MYISSEVVVIVGIILICGPLVPLLGSLLGLGAVTVVVYPVAAVASCLTDEGIKRYNDEQAYRDSLALPMWQQVGVVGCLAGTAFLIAQCLH